jgi:hypothetical protein
LEVNVPDQQSHFEYKKYLPCFALAVIFAVAVYGAFYGSPSVYVVSGIVIAGILFWLRKRRRLLYGVTEVLAGLFTLQQSSTIGRGGFNSGFSDGFQAYRWQLILIATLGAIYIIIRGLDNIEHGWHHRAGSGSV